MTHPTLAVAGPAAWPGQDALAAHRSSLDVLADPPSGLVGAPGLLALPGRGPWASPLARTLALCEAMPAALEPHGWRLGTTADGTLRRAGRTLTGDVEALALAAAGYAGPIELPVLGPLSLAAATWLPVGERVVSDDVARADLAASLALGLSRHVAAVTAARDLGVVLDGAVPSGEAAVGGDADSGAASRTGTVVLHEPMLTEVLQGAVPTFSGMSRLRALEAGVVASTIREVAEAMLAAGQVVVLAVPPDARVIDVVGPVLAAAGGGVQVDVMALDRRGMEALAQQVENGLGVRCAVVPHAAPPQAGDVPADPARIATELLQRWRWSGVVPPRLTVLPRSGVASLTPARARETLTLAARCSVALGDALA
ncbi:hypothetical protein [Serinibacter salmoneus]|uniref:Cobalamin-independent methionine synthase catalytic subunit n=1 Tax=Serinibacter salmoneus TaxID=556530 RepID=A0A2A9D0S1_9MICO|nr:hypothetical protein [Serinibacter salmoneus]PFG20243.1 hypothetical protein ATL40_1839 [Serinibacter salmoneus]